MDHSDIDARDIAVGYLRHTLSADDQAAFEAHLVDCPECADRVLLAEMFHARNGAAPRRQPEIPLHAHLLARLTPWQLLILLGLAALLLLAIPGIGIYWVEITLLR